MRIIYLVFILSMFIISCTQNDIHTTEKYSKVDSLLSVMTLEEKVGQLNMYTGSWEFTGPVPKDMGNQKKMEYIKSGKVGSMLNVLGAANTMEAQKAAVENSRLGIPLVFAYDVIHGYKTMFPVPLAQAASWDLEVAEMVARKSAVEASASGIHWTFAPMIDISRDARWGRIMEGAGEDPFLNSVFGKAWIKGYQGDDLSDPNTIAACAKHFAAYGFGVAAREYNTAEISNSTLHNIVLPPFKAAVDAGVATVMNSFNEIDGIPATGSKYLQREFLKGKWDFKGAVVSDWGTIGELMVHGFAADSAEAAKLAIEAGSDIDMEAHVYEGQLLDLVENGTVDEKILDDAVRRVLKLKYDLGLFEDPYRYCSTEREDSEVYTEAIRKIARETAKKSIVLLKNESILPYNDDPGSILVIGPIGNSKDIPLGSWRGQAISNSAVSLLEGIQNRYPNSKVSFTEGYKLTTGSRSFYQELTFAEEDYSGFKEAIVQAGKHDKVIFAMGEDCFQSGEARSQVDIRPKGAQVELLMKVLDKNENVTVVLMNGRPLQIPEVIEKAPAIVETWFLGSEAGNAIADVLSGDYNPSGKLPVTFPVHIGQEPLYYNRKHTGRPYNPGQVFWSHYTDSPNEGILPFGFGLSYTTFEYSDLKIEEMEDKSLNVSVVLSNTGQIAGTETVQVYVRDHASSETQPIKELVDFSKVALEAGEQKNVIFSLTKEDLGFWNSNGEFIFEPGTFTIMVGGNSVDLLKEIVDVKF